MKMSRIIIIKTVLIVLIVLAMAEGLSEYFAGSEIQRKVVSADWTVRFNDQIYKTDNLEQLNIPMIKKGDHIEVYTKLPDAGFEQTTLEFQLRYCVIHVYLEDQEIYSYGEDHAAMGSLVGSGSMYVSLPPDYAEKTLRISMEVQENGVFTKFSEMYLQESRDTYYNLITDRSLTIIVAGFLICSGLTALCIAMYMQRKENHAAILFWTAIFSITMSIWLYCYSGAARLLKVDYHLTHVIGYISLYLAPVSLLFFISEFLQGAKHRYIIKWLGIGFATFDVVVILLNSLNIIHFPVVLRTFHSITLLCCLISIIIGIRYSYTTNKLENRVFVYGIILFIIIVVIDIIRYLIDKNINTNWDLSQTYIPIGILILVLAMMLSFSIKMREATAIHMEQQVLLRIAYTDPLTKIGNRARCEEEFRVYEENSKPVTVINLDLNFLKAVNDNIGHSAGDELLSRFAHILERVFKDRGFVGRMGGDEFIVVMDYCSNEKVQIYIHELLDQIELFNSESHKPFQISVAYGSADNHENPEMHIWKVYEEADKLMYEYKNKYKRSRDL